MTRLRRGDPGLIRDLNRAAILGLIGDERLIARVEIARRLALSPATVTDITRELVDEGLVREVDQGPSSGGRRPMLLGLVGEAAQAIGVKIAADHVALVRVALDGTLLARETEPFDTAGADVLERLQRHLARAVDGAAGFPGRLLGIGLGVPGIVDARGIVQSPMLGWRDLDLAPLLRARLSVPVLIDNDVNTLAVAERLYGLGRGLDHTLTVTLGRGIGLGIVVAGDLYRGARGGAGEFGHVAIEPGGPPCECGLRGCLEALVADPALVGEAVAAGLLPQGVTMTEGRARLRALADAGDDRARAIYARAGTILGRAVASLVNVLSPELIIVSGEGSDAWPHLGSAFREALDAATFPPLRGVDVQVDPWDDAKWAHGAAAIVLRATFVPPIYDHIPDAAVRERLTSAPPASPYA